MAWVVPSAATNCQPAASLWGISPMETTSCLGPSDAPSRSLTWSRTAARSFKSIFSISSSPKPASWSMALATSFGTSSL